MDKFRRTTIRSKKKNIDSALIGDLVESGALIFTKTQVDLQTIKRGDAFWRLLIRMVQWFRWSGTKGDPSTITHVDGWDGSLAFGSDLCDPEGGGLNRHVLPIVPHCFLSKEGEPLIIEEKNIEVINKKKHSHTIRIEDLATCDFEVIQLPESLRVDFLKYQERFRNDDIRYSLKKAAKTVITNSKFSEDAKKTAVADAIYAYLNEPFRTPNGDVLQVCCSTFLAKILIAIEHKQLLEVFIEEESFPLKQCWQRNLKHLRKGFKELGKYHLELITLKKQFDKDWNQFHKKDGEQPKGSLIETCLDFSEQRGFLLRRMRRLSRDLAHRIQKMAAEFMSMKLYERYFDNEQMPLKFKLHPEKVTPAKLYAYLIEVMENE